MSEVYKIIGLRDIEPSLEQEFKELLKKGSVEAEQIKNGYTNPLAVANIIRCRVRCLEGA